MLEHVAVNGPGLIIILPNLRVMDGGLRLACLREMGMKFCQVEVVSKAVRNPIRKLPLHKAIWRSCILRMMESISLEELSKRMKKNVRELLLHNFVEEELKWNISVKRCFDANPCWDEKEILKACYNPGYYDEMIPRHDFAEYESFCWEPDYFYHEEW
jgi:hypothetical protein